MTTERYDRTLTAEDDAIVQRLSHVAFMTWLAEARDSTDYRAMLAREVLKEREWRIGGVSVTPAECALRDLEPANLRMTIEAINGEPL